MYDRSNLYMWTTHIQERNQNIRSSEKKKIASQYSTIIRTWSTDLSKMSKSHVSFCGKLGIEDLYFEIMFQTAPASFVGNKSRGDASDSSTALEARYRTDGSSWDNVNLFAHYQLKRKRRVQNTHFCMELCCYYYLKRTKGVGNKPLSQKQKLQY